VPTTLLMKRDTHHVQVQLDAVYRDIVSQYYFTGQCICGSVDVT